MSQWCPTRGKQKGRITFLSLLATHLLMQPKMQLSFWAASSLLAKSSFSPSSVSPSCLSRAALIPFIPQPALVSEIVPTHVENLVLGLVDPHEIPMGLLDPVQLPLNGILSFRAVNRTTEPGVIYKFAEGALNSTVYAVDKGIKYYRSQFGINLIQIRY